MSKALFLFADSITLSTHNARYITHKLNQFQPNSPAEDLKYSFILG